jgi:hypothetical protein
MSGRWERSQPCQDMQRRDRCLYTFVDADSLLIGLNTPPGDVALIDSAGALTLQRRLAEASYHSLQLGTSASVIPVLHMPPESFDLADVHGDPVRVGVAARGGNVNVGLSAGRWFAGDPAKIRDLADSLYRAADVAEQQRRS